jgi:dienelactone hydrolase
VLSWLRCSGMTSPRATRRNMALRRRRMAFALGAAVVAVAVAFLFAGLALFDDGHGKRASSAATASTSALTTTTTTALTPLPTTGAPGAAAPPSTTAALSPTDISRTHAVGTRAATFVDPSRPTSANGSYPGAPNRTFPTSFWYPAQGAAGGAPVADAAPDTAHGPYPLVLFAHGYNVTPAFYAPLLERWAAAGYVVAAPTYPILSGNDGGASHVDYEQTWADSSFVITQVLGLSGADPLAGLVDRNRIAVAGHSDGEVIAFGVGFLACCRDPRVRSVIAMAGDLSNANNPSVRDTGTPILHIMETGDEYDPYAHSIQWDRDNLTSPRWLVSLDSTHVPPYTQPGDPAFELVSRITVAYLDGTLKGHRERLDDVTSAVVAQPDVGAIER